MTPRRGRPSKISRDQIIDAAVAIGLDSFSMTAIAEHLGVTPPALYSHVSGRDEVLALVTDELMARIEQAITEERDWRSFLDTFAHTLREHLAGSQWATLTQIDVVATAAVDLAERSLGVLTDAGFDDTEAAQALWLVARIALTAGTPAEPSIQRQRGIAAQLIAPTAELPNLQAATATMDGDGPADSFDSDLDIVLDGLASRLTAASRQRRTGS